MSLYLILHKVRGEPAFDIAQKLDLQEPLKEVWIIPTSGHRAYPYASALLDDLHFVYEGGTISALKDMLAGPMPDIRDHYALNEPAPTATIKSRPKVTADDLLI